MQSNCHHKDLMTWVGDKSGFSSYICKLFFCALFTTYVFEEEKIRQALAELCQAQFRMAAYMLPDQQTKLAYMWSDSEPDYLLS